MNYLVLAVCIAAPMVVGALNGIATQKGIREWYPSLAKPSWNPPNWVFAPVWTVLYIMIGVALWIVLGAAVAPGLKFLAAALWVVQLGVNALWSPAFFVKRDPALALRVVFAMDVAVAATVVAFFTVSPLAGALLLPYLAWGLFATVLNRAIVRLN